MCRGSMYRRRPLGTTVRGTFLVTVLMAAVPVWSLWAATAGAPYGVAEERTQRYDAVDTVLDAHAYEPSELDGLADAIQELTDHLKGRIVVVIDGPASALFARVNYMRHRPLIDRLALQAEQGVQFRVARGALTALGYAATDLHGFVTVIVSGFAEIAHLQGKGHRYTRFAPGDRSGVQQPHGEDRREQEPRLKFEY